MEVEEKEEDLPAAVLFYLIAEATSLGNKWNKIIDALFKFPRSFPFGKCGVNVADDFYIASYLIKNIPWYFSPVSSIVSAS